MVAGGRAEEASTVLKPHKFDPAVDECPRCHARVGEQCALDVVMPMKKTDDSDEGWIDIGPISCPRKTS
jgi:hypothetical protein